MQRISIFACEAQPIVLEGLNKVLSNESGFELVGSASDLASASARIVQIKPDVVLLDTAAGFKTTLQFVGELRFLCPTCRAVLWVNDLAEVESFRSLQLGVKGVVKKTFPIYQLLECLKSVGEGNIWLENSISQQVNNILNRKTAPRFTPRERDIVGLVCRGMKNKEIAEELYITPGTVKVHLMHIFEKAGVKDRFELAVQGRQLLGGDGPLVSATLPSQDTNGSPRG